MRIGIDVDETLVCSNDEFEIIKKKYNIDFNKKYTDKWTDEEYQEILAKYAEEIITNASLKIGAKEALNYLHNKGHKLIIITARNNLYYKNSMELTKKVLLNHGLKIDEFYFDQDKKSDIAKKLNIDLMIDDNINIYESMKKENIDCILFGQEIKTWDQVLEYIDRM